MAWIIPASSSHALELVPPYILSTPINACVPYFGVRSQIVPPSCSPERDQYARIYLTIDNSLIITKLSELQMLLHRLLYIYMRFSVVATTSFT